MRKAHTNEDQLSDVFAGKRSASSEPSDLGVQVQVILGAIKYRWSLMLGWNSDGIADPEG
jgi:hypothetical protein